MYENKRILIVEDDPGIRESYLAILTPSEKEDLLSTGDRLFSRTGQEADTVKREVYDLTLTGTGEMGVEAARKAVIDNSPFAVAFLDMKMPGMNGAETARQMWLADPDIKIVIVTAYSEYTPDDILRVTGRKDIFYLRKPFNPEEIGQFARALTNQWCLEREKAALGEKLERANQILEEKVTRRTERLRRSEKKLKNTLTTLRKALDATFQALTAVMEVRDPYTAGHQRRVANLARAIAAEMQLPDSACEGIRMAGTIHDIGKISIPAEILNRPGKQGALEREMIKSHPQAGYDILKNIVFPWPVAEIELQHHERMDGSGYPRGLAGEDILIEARVIAVADVVEAMDSHRPYRPALGLEKAMEEIAKNRGTLYDADTVDACLKIIKENNFHLPELTHR